MWFARNKDGLVALIKPLPEKRHRSSFGNVADWKNKGGVVNHLLDREFFD